MIKMRVNIEFDNVMEELKKIKEIRMIKIVIEMRIEMRIKMRIEIIVSDK